MLRRVAGAASLLDAIRIYGHFMVATDPLGGSPPGAAELQPSFHGIAEEDLALVPAEALGVEGGTAADVAARLRSLYQSNLGFEFEHIENETERQWFRTVIEQEGLRRTLSPDERRTLLHRLTEVDALERFIHRKYVNVKRFSIEGTDALVPMLDIAIHDAASGGAREVVMGMAHRGRINVLAHILGKPYGTIFDEFDGKHADIADSETGDVKYHLGFESERVFEGGRRVRLTLVPNPSHLEIVNPVLTGLARAKQRAYGRAFGAPDGRGASVLPILVHGDAAFPGEGVVAETFNMSALRGYGVGGTLHIICNNQVGFTTNPGDGRSTYYASDLAKGFEVPIVHVNADDAEACIAAVRLGIAYRHEFAKDFLIDLVGYRRWGHNEGDEPAFTQPSQRRLLGPAGEDRRSHLQSDPGRRRAHRRAGGRPSGSHQQYSASRSRSDKSQSAPKNTAGPRPAADFSRAEPGLQAPGQRESAARHHPRHRPGSNHQAYSRRQCLSFERPVGPAGLRLRAERESLWLRSGKSETVAE
jgi:2-oxoglutarate dehydrogenase E1 component